MIDTVIVMMLSASYLPLLFYLMSLSVLRQFVMMIFNHISPRHLEGLYRPTIINMHDMAYIYTVPSIPTCTTCTEVTNPFICCLHTNNLIMCASELAPCRKMSNHHIQYYLGFLLLVYQIKPCEREHSCKS